MDKRNKKFTNDTSTDLFYFNLADPSKLVVKNNTAKIVQINDSEHNDSFMVHMDGDKKADSSKLKFHSDEKRSHSDKKLEANKPINLNLKDSKSKSKSKSKSGSKSKSKSKSHSHSSEKKKLEDAIHDNLKMDMNNFSERPPVDKPIAQTLNKIGNGILDLATAKNAKFRKMECWAELQHIKSEGYELTKDYTKDSDLEEMEAEIKFHRDIKRKKDGVEIAKSLMCNIITGIEFLNDKYNKFNFKLNGWSKQVKSNKEDFNEVFSELYDKYKGSGSHMEPELKLLLMLIMSGVTFHMSKTIAGNIPAIEDIIKNNPALMANIQSGINKTISGPTEYEKRKEVYNNVKKIHDEKVKKKNIQPAKSKSKSKSIPKTNNKPESVQSILQTIRNTMPADNATDSAITVGDTVETETSKHHSVSKNIETKNDA